MTLRPPEDSAEKHVIALLNEMAHARGIHVSELWKWILHDLEVINVDEIQVPKRVLAQVDSRFKALNSELRELQRTAAAKEEMNATLSVEINRATMRLTERERQLSESTAELGALHKRLAALDGQLIALERERKQVNYELMMRPHSGEPRLKIIRWALRIFTAVGVLIALYFIFRKVGHVP